jgi:hypothetical protein
MQAWTDERLNDLKKQVDDGFIEMRAEFRAVRGEISALNRTILAMFLTMIIGFVGLALAMLTHV